MALIKARPLPQSSILGGDFGNLLYPTPRSPPTLYSTSDGPTAQHDNDYSAFQSIEILPTTDEILASDKPVYLPKKDLREPNPISAGFDRLLDLSFRLLRFESVEPIIDIVYSAAQTAYIKRPSAPSSSHPNPTSTRTHEDTGQLEPRHETPNGNRYFLFQSVQIEELLPHEVCSVLVRLSFDCPTFMRGRKIHHTGRFEEGMLVALLCLDTLTRELEVFYLQVHMLQSTHSMSARGGQGRKAAVQVSFLPGTTRATVQHFAKYAQKLCPEVEMWLVEFPKLLHAGFYHCLRRLQQIQAFAFSNIVAPAMSATTIEAQNRNHATYGRPPPYPCQPPRYAEEPGFEFHLAPITKPGTAVEVASYTLGELADPSSVAMIESMTSLDPGQAVALRHSLRSDFAFTQGPPGTGKSYIGIALTRVLLASLPVASKKPILVVCLTNHALDSFLGGLKDAGVQNLLRIGSGSKEEWTKSINLLEKRSKSRWTPNESSRLHSLKAEARDLLSDIDAWCSGQSSQELTGEVTWFAIEPVLFNYHRDVYEQFKTAAASSVLLGPLFDFWVKGGDLQDVADLRTAIVRRLANNPSLGDGDDVDAILTQMCSKDVEQYSLLVNSSVWSIPPDRRKTLLQTWASRVDSSALADDLARLYVDHRATREKKQSYQNDRDARIMQQADVIGLTTTACAGKWDLLNALNLQILICEEAGEVLEPHVICALLPTLQHAIFIGDPQQLRPKVSEHRLSLECTQDYRLDESLFEKMIFPRDSALTTLPMAQLNIQRRMHPMIADISRITYPHLQDHSSTREHESTTGLLQRIFWWDHRVPEVPDTGISKSHINQNEVEMVVGLVEYLLKTSAYSQGDIAVLTPYSGQLARLYGCLKTTCKIWLDARDREMLLSEDLLDDQDGPRSKDDVSVSDMLRIATVDNFQGEEAKIVILTTVRSGGSAGFLSIPNRVNVACSRARNGFYIIGNSETLSRVAMWRDIIKVFGVRRSFVLTTTCPNHPTHRHEVYRPGDFMFIPECPRACQIHLPCGHLCPESCHSLELHAKNMIPCAQRCAKLLNCGHRCAKRCGETCGPCAVTTSEVILDCGHLGSAFCSGEISKCYIVLGKKKLGCGHEIDANCGEQQQEYICKQACDAQLDCGHHCMGLCCACNKDGHPKCVSMCAKQLACGHRCEDECGHGGQCPPCEKSVQVACEHGVKAKPCNQPAELCLMPQSNALGPTDDIQTPCCLPTLTALASDQKVVDLTRTMDTFIGQVYTQLPVFSSAVGEMEATLANNLELFKNSVRAGPLAAASNSRLLMNRKDISQDFMDKIRTYRVNIVEPFERHIVKLAESSKFIPPFQLVAVLHFQTVQTRGLLAALSDQVRVGEYLLNVDDPSSTTRNAGIQLLNAAAYEAIRCYSEKSRYLAATATLVASPSLHVEAILQEIAAWIVAEYTLNLTGSTYVGHASLSIVLPAFFAALDLAIDISKQFPATNKGFLETAVRFRQILTSIQGGSHPSSLPSIDYTGARRQEKQYCGYANALGSGLTICDVGHPYFKAVFGAGCPVCGHRVQPDDEMFREAGEHLFEEKFLAAMRRL